MPAQIARYPDRISAPLLDRIDMRVEVSSLGEGELVALPAGEHATQVAERVLVACKRSFDRPGQPNHALSGADIERIGRPEGSVKQLQHAASARLGWSARAYRRVLKVARTIAELEDVEAISAAHVAEAIQYRRSLRES